MYAEIDQQGLHRIVVSGRNDFVALDRQLRLRIEQLPDGRMGGEVQFVRALRTVERDVVIEQLITLAVH